jgi:hypothetical protein
VPPIELFDNAILVNDENTIHCVDIVPDNPLSRRNLSGVYGCCE